MNEIAGKEFYDQFYNVFFSRYGSFEDLDDYFVNYKLYVAKYLEKSIVSSKASAVLSIGCGIGIVENYLVNNSNLNIVAIEPSDNVSKWLRGNPAISLCDGYFPGCLPAGSKFDFVYANGIDYVFNESEYQEFLKSIIEFGVKDFLVVSSSVYGAVEIFKSYLKHLLKIVGIMDQDDFGQFWGYMRSSREQKDAMHQAGFSRVNLVKGKNNVLFIHASV